jgi:hypothetical protein
LISLFDSLWLQRSFDCDDMWAGGGAVGCVLHHLFIVDPLSRVCYLPATAKTHIPKSAAARSDCSAVRVLRDCCHVAYPTCRTRPQAVSRFGATDAGVRDLTVCVHRNESGCGGSPNFCSFFVRCCVTAICVQVQCHHSSDIFSIAARAVCLHHSHVRLGSGDGCDAHSQCHSFAPHLCHRRSDGLRCALSLVSCLIYI